MKYEIVKGVLIKCHDIFKYYLIGKQGEEYSVRAEESVFLNHVLDDLKIEEEKRRSVRQVLKNSMKAHFETIRVSGKPYFIIGYSETEGGNITYYPSKKDKKKMDKEGDDSMTFTDDNTM